LKERGCGHIKIFGGGGGVILPEEIEELQAYGITRIYSPDDGRHLGLQGMINEVVELSDYPTGKDLKITKADILKRDYHAIAQLISAAENHH
jgi:methylmalonyl-CoA mutase